MKKFLRIVVIILLLLVAVVVVAGLIAPKETNIQTSIDINAPREQVWEQAMKFKNWGNWSYWHRIDTNQTVTYAGTDGEPGSSYSWKGEETGEGTMTNKGMENGKMNYELKFIKPFEGTSDGYIMVEDAGNGVTKVTWTFHSVNDNFLMRAMGAIMGMEKMLKSQFDEGLANMKKHVEEHKGDAPAAANFTIQDAQFPGNTYAGVRKTIKWADMEKTMPGMYETTAKAAGDRITGPAIAIYYNWDTVKKEADVYAGFPVKDDKSAAGTTIVKIPAAKAYLVNFTGNYDQLEKIHYQIGAHAEKNKTEVAYVLEEYLKMAPEEKDMNKWETNVYYISK
ncbi:MAG: SRPBCC family protein [Sediminibacterium sp.]|nr:SRPBCC family protein [Sediminibacterium sp.]